MTVVDNNQGSLIKHCLQFVDRDAAQLCKDT